MTYRLADRLLVRLIVAALPVTLDELWRNQLHDVTAHLQARVSSLFSWLNRS